MTLRLRSIAETNVFINAVQSLVSIVDSWVHDLIRIAIVKQPRKLKQKLNVPARIALEASSIEDFHRQVADFVLESWSYESPDDFVKRVDDILSIDLQPEPSWHRFVELKATRDIWVHNGGYVNDTYVRKSKTLSRAEAGALLPITPDYFWECYEFCLKLTEATERMLHDKYGGPLKQRCEAEFKAQWEQHMTEPAEDDSPKEPSSVDSSKKSK